MAWDEAQQQVQEQGYRHASDRLSNRREEDLIREVLQCMKELTTLLILNSKCQSDLLSLVAYTSVASREISRAEKWTFQ
jgi:hypothetical protein